MRASGRLRSGSALLVVATLGAVVAAALVDPAASVAAARQDKAHAVQIGRAPNGSTLGGPNVLVTGSGGTVVAWRQRGSSVDTLRMVRRADAADPFAPVTIKSGALTEFGEPYLTEDPITDRLLLTASGQSDGAVNLGLYAWTSYDDGATWSSPKRVWDSFATGQIALDGLGGFYAITDQTGVSVTHVPKSLTMRMWPGDDLYLSDRIGGRGGLGIATVGADHVLVVAFVDSNGRPWLHVSDREGRRFDRDFFVCCQVEPFVELASNDRGTVLAFQIIVADGFGRGYELQAASIEELASGEIAVERQVIGTQDDVTWLAVNPLPATTAKATWQFQLAWLDSDGRLRVSASTPTGDDHLEFGPAETVLRFPTKQHFQFPGPLTAHGSVVTLHAYDDELREVQLAVTG